MTDYSMNTLSNGLRVLCVPMKERASVGVAIWIRTGARYEQKNISGVSHLLEHMLFKGTTRRSTPKPPPEARREGGFARKSRRPGFRRLLLEKPPE